jgi:hypothetical protein
MMSPAAADITVTAFNNSFQPPWVGTLDSGGVWLWIDNFLLLVRHIYIYIYIYIYTHTDLPHDGYICYVAGSVCLMGLVLSGLR